MTIIAVKYSNLVMRILEIDIGAAAIRARLAVIVSATCYSLKVLSL